MTKKELIFVAIIGTILMCIIGYGISQRYEEEDSEAQTIVGNIRTEQESKINIDNYDNYGMDNNSSNNKNNTSDSNKEKSNTTNTNKAVENIAYSNSNTQKLKDANVLINGKKYTATLYNNPTAKELIEQLPLKLTLSELDGVEKYSYMGKSFTEGKEKVTEVKCGDIVLYGNNCLVLFYSDSNTTNRYTKIGKIDNNSDLEELSNYGNIDIEISLTDKEK